MIIMGWDVIQISCQPEMVTAFVFSNLVRSKSAWKPFEYLFIILALFYCTRYNAQMENANKCIGTKKR